MINIKYFIKNIVMIYMKDIQKTLKKKKQKKHVRQDKRTGKKHVREQKRTSKKWGGYTDPLYGRKNLCGW